MQWNVTRFSYAVHHYSNSNVFKLIYERKFANWKHSFRSAVSQRDFCIRVSIYSVCIFTAVCNSTILYDAYTCQYCMMDSMKCLLFNLKLSSDVVSPNTMYIRNQPCKKIFHRLPNASWVAFCVDAKENSSEYQSLPVLAGTSSGWD